MSKLEFTRQIAATPARVWEVLWNEETYPKWTSPFAPMSTAISDWNEGSEIRFVDGKGEGMICTIRRKIDNKYMSFEMQGMVKDGKAVLEGSEVEQWKGGQENYTLTEKDSGTELYIELTSTGMDEGMVDYFRKVWPVALDKLAELATGNAVQ
ncbi:MAG: SRPBCC domain-containing protein [Chitinophagaceae bacterium]|nr:MAG: SRPBCC domain-containing protein [Chitinophagaceae bacterium]